MDILQTWNRDNKLNELKNPFWDRKLYKWPHLINLGANSGDIADQSIYYQTYVYILTIIYSRE